MLDADSICRSRSPLSFLVVIMEKKDGSKHFCVDFRRLNKITVKVCYPLPSIDDIQALLGKSKNFTSLDLKSGHWQVAIDEKDKQKTAFACHKGLYEFNVMSFGLSNAPAVFQELKSVVLHDCQDFATAYLDDIMIFEYTQSTQEHAGVQVIIPCDIYVLQEHHLEHPHVCRNGSTRGFNGRPSSSLCHPF